jgi:hypothetical protein
MKSTVTNDDESESVEQLDLAASDQCEELLSLYQMLQEYYYHLARRRHVEGAPRDAEEKHEAVEKRKPSGRMIGSDSFILVGVDLYCFVLSISFPLLTPRQQAQAGAGRSGRRLWQEEASAWPTRHWTRDVWRERIELFFWLLSISSFVFALISPAGSGSSRRTSTGPRP